MPMREAIALTLPEFMLRGCPAAQEQAKGQSAGGFGGFSRTDACAELAKNPGMIASFSRALLSDLRHQMNDEEFNRELAIAIDEIHVASVG